MRRRWGDHSRRPSHAFRQAVLHFQPHFWYREPFQDIADEGMHQHGFSGLEPNAAGAGIKQRIRVELPHGAPVAALDIVRINFQFGLGVHARLVAGEDVRVLLVGIGLLGIRAHEHLAIEHPGALAVQNAFVVLRAGAMGHAVIHRGVVVHEFALSRQEGAVQLRMGSLAVDAEGQIVSYPNTAYRDGVYFRVGSAALANVFKSNVTDRSFFVLHLVDVQARTLSDVRTGQYVHRPVRISGSCRPLDKFHGSIQRHSDVVPQHIERASAAGVVVNQNGAVQLNALRHPQEQSLLAVAAVQACEPIRSLGRKGIDILKFRITPLSKRHARHAWMHR